MIRRVALVCLFSLLMVIRPCFGADSFALYQVGVEGQQFWSLARDYLRGKGYDALFQLGEVTIEKHLERMGRINKSPAKFLLAMELVPREDSNVLVAMMDVKNGEGRPSAQPGEGPTPGTGNGLTTFAGDAQSGNRFLSMDEVPGKYVSDSRKLADAVAGAFNVKVKRVPLFPLLGADMPGIYLRIECRQDKVGEMLGILHAGIQNYLRRDVLHERQR